MEDDAGINTITTTARREWWGWFGSMVWLFFMMYGHDTFMLSETAYNEGGADIPFFFMLVFALTMIALAWQFGRNPDGLSKIAFYTTPAAIAITAVFTLLPEPVSAVLFVVSPVFFAPAMIRRVYGVLHTSEPGKRITRYMGGIAVCVVLFTVWIMIEPPIEIAFLVPALLSVPAWLGVRRSVTLPDRLPNTTAFKLSKRYILLLVAAFIALLWFNLMNTSIHSNILYTGIEESNPLYMILGYILPLVGFMLYGVVHDKGHERLGFICGMGLCVVGVILALIPSETQNSMLIPLAFTSGLGGTYSEFFILTIPVFFFIGAKRPVFVASLGVIANLISSAYMWLGEGDLIPEFIKVPDAPLFASTAISAIVFIVLVYFIFERRREKTLAAALYAMLYIKEDVETHTPGKAEATEEQKMADIGFTDDEIKVAMLLIEGATSWDITRKLHSTAADTGSKMAAIRKKISGVDDHDPIITAVVKEYKLTHRQTEMLRYIRDGITNSAIANMLSVSEETVKWHMRNLKKKLSISYKQEIAEWLDDFGKEQS
jgi:DNA-binding CsgD family transcriptional regulator